MERLVRARLTAGFEVEVTTRLPVHRRGRRPSRGPGTDLKYRRTPFIYEGRVSQSFR
ncbi:hypothetical protein GZL_01656 [Streptomyces sp. 769]|nr:hypothetical protein GZL_01656 [Streptomyces sp. 769]